jgi:integrase
MTAWDPRLGRAGDKPRREWKDNEEIIAAWLEHMRLNNYSRNVLIHYPYDARVFARPWKDTLLTTLQADDVQQFVDLYATKCSRLMNGASPRCRIGHDIKRCPVLTGMPSAACPGYLAMDPAGILGIIRTVKALYAWLVEEGHIPFNPVDPIFRKYKRRNRGLLTKRARNPRRRTITVEEVRAMVKGSPPNHAVVYALMGKCFLRIHEALKLRLDPPYCSLDEGWFDLPPDQKFGDKRLGNTRILVDAELMSVLRSYLAWRESRVRRREDGTPETDRLVLTNYGTEWGEGWKGNFRKAMHDDCVRLGLMTGMETDRAQRVNPHCFRAFATTWARDHRATDAEVQVLRGDKAAGAIDRYDMYMARLPELYRQFGPVLGL